jgi:hypothetical protein
MIQNFKNHQFDRDLNHKVKKSIKRGNECHHKSHRLNHFLDGSNFVGFGPWLRENVDFYLSAGGFKDHLVVHTSHNLLVDFDQLTEVFMMFISEFLAGDFLRLDKALLRSDRSELILVNFSVSTDHLNKNVKVPGRLRGRRRKGGVVKQKGFSWF